LKALAETKSP